MIATHPALIWLVAGLALLVVEVLTPGVFMVWLGLAALGTGGVQMLHPLEFGWQVTLFAVLACCAISVALMLRRRNAAGHVNSPASGLVGRPARVLALEGEEIRVRLGDSDWPARLEAGTPRPEAGAVLRVVAVDGTVLVVADAAGRSREMEYR